jgi:hypothetical protein
MDIKILIPLILLLLSEGVAAIWWAGATDSDVKRLQDKVVTIEQNQLDIQTIRTTQSHNTGQLEKNEQLLKEILREMRSSRSD